MDHLGSVTNDLKLRPCADLSQDLVDSPEHPILDQILWAVRTLEDRKLLEDHDAGVADLER